MFSLGLRRFFFFLGGEGGFGKKNELFYEFICLGFKRRSECDLNVEWCESFAFLIVLEWVLFVFCCFECCSDDFI